MKEVAAQKQEIKSLKSTLADKHQQSQECQNTIDEMTLVIAENNKEIKFKDKKLEEQKIAVQKSLTQLKVAREQVHRLEFLER
jgi:uncharacterized protein (DUF3084 family)